MFIFLIFALLAFAIYLYFQSKVKNHRNFPVVYAMLLGFLVILSGSSLLPWLIGIINANTPLTLPLYEPISWQKMLGFGLYLIVLVALYYRKPSSGGAKNIFFSLFNFGNVKQSNSGGDASKENQDIMQKKLDKLLQ